MNQPPQEPNRTDRCDPLNRAYGGGPEPEKPRGEPVGQPRDNGEFSRSPDGSAASEARKAAPARSCPSVRVEFIAVGGSEGEALEDRQLAVIREILEWQHRRTVPVIAGGETVENEQTR
jgi:hypothetical protein